MIKFCNGDPSTRCGKGYAAKNGGFQRCFGNNYGPENETQFYSSWPLIELKFDNGNILEWEPQSYLYKESGLYCFAIEEIEDRFILGLSFIKGHDILFDRQNNQVSFVKANCTHHYDSSEENAAKWEPIYYHSDRVEDIDGKQYALQSKFWS